jgi:hypothetical protein
MAYPDHEWQREGATVSEKTARQEFGLIQDEINDAIDAGTLQCHQTYLHGNPWLRLLPPRGRDPRPGQARRPARQRTAGQGGTAVSQPQDQAPVDRADRTHGAASQARLRSR